MLSFCDILLKLQEFWKNQGCLILQPYDIEAVIEVYREAGAGIEVDTASEGGVLIEPAT